MNTIKKINNPNTNAPILFFFEKYFQNINAYIGKIIPIVCFESKPKNRRKDDIKYFLVYIR